MKERNLTVDTVRSISEREKRLYSRGISVSVSSIAQGGHTLICTAFQYRRAPLSRPIPTVDLVKEVEVALAPLLGAGFTPMISAVDWDHSEHLRNSHDPPSDHDPIGLISALREEGLPFPRLSASVKEEGQKALIAVPFWRKALGFFAV